MKKIYTILAAAASLLLAGCVEEKLVEPQEQRPDILGEPITITVGVPEKTPMSKVALGGAEGLDLTWEDGDQLIVAGFGANGYMGTADFTIQSDFAGQTSAMFDGHKIKGATSYVVYYKTPNLKFDSKGAATMSYENMTTAAVGSAEVVSDHLFLKSDEINDSDLGSGQWTLTAQNSVLKVDFKNCPRNLVRVNAIDWNIVQADGTDRETMRLLYTGPGANLTNTTFNFGTVYFCFNPVVMSLQPGESICFRLNGEGGSNFSYTHAGPANGMAYMSGRRYTATVEAYNEPIADIFDGYFTKDGECHDLSISGRGVNPFLGEATWVAAPEGYNNLAAYFNHTFGKQPTSGAYTFPDSGLSAKFSDGYSMEAYVMCNVYLESMGAESKAFGSTNGGGTALMITKNKHLAFLTCGKIKPGTGQYWQFAESDVTPVVGTWYHLVGVYDGKTGHQKFYIDGELKSDKHIGIINYHPNQLAEPFWGIGANSWGGTAENPKFNNAWNGAVARPRIYSVAMDDAQVKAVYNQFKHVNPAPVVPEKPAAPKADLLDVVFNADGSATDVSPMGMIVEHKDDAAHLNYYNKAYKRNVAHFSHEPGSSTSSGFFKVSYENNQKFIDGLKDGHTLEVLFSAQSDLTNAKKSKMFSSHQGGGLGFEVNGGKLSFVPYVGKGYKSANDTEKLISGKYYHAVGVWDKSAGKAKIYVNGVKKTELDASGELKMGSVSWIAIGADPVSANSAENAWSGDVVLARIYDNPLTDEQIRLLYDQVNVPQDTNPILLSNIQYLPNASVNHGWKYYIYANGIKSGDELILDAMDSGKKTLWPEIQATEGKIIMTVPTALTNGRYRLILKRGEYETFVGNVEFTIGDISEPAQTKVIAHRGYHPEGGPLPNTLDAFTQSAQKNFWGAEIDVHISKDDVVLVDHDGYATYYGQKQHFSSIPSGSVALSKKPRFKDFLEAMLKDCPNLNLVLEIKDQPTLEISQNLVQTCYDLINSEKYKSLKNRICWIAFNPELCKQIVSLASNDPDWKDCMVMLLGQNGNNSDQSIYTPEKMKEWKFGAIDYKQDFYRANPTWIPRAHKLGMKVNVWTVDNAMDMMYFIGRGVDYITTDQPDRLQEILGNTFITK